MEILDPNGWLAITISSLIAGAIAVFVMYKVFRISGGSLAPTCTDEAMDNNAILLPRIYHEAPMDILFLVVAKCKGNKNYLRLVSRLMKEAVDECVESIEWRKLREYELGYQTPTFIPLFLLQMKKIKHCGLIGTRFLFSLEKVPTSVTSLDVSLSGLLTLKTSNPFESLLFLDISATHVKGLAPLSKCKKLHTLYCCNTPVADLGPLSDCKALINLHCGFTRVTCLKPLSGCTNLTLLSCGTNAISDISPLAECTKLEVLKISQTTVKDLSPLAQCAQLTKLHIQQTSINNISSLSACLRLRKLYAFASHVNDLSPLFRLGQLTDLSVSQKTLLKGQVDAFKKEIPQCRIHYS